MEKIVCVCGHAQNGKDTFASMSKEILTAKGKSVLIVHYADYLKFIAKTYFDWDGQKNEKGRSLLQWLGTDKIRAINNDFWVTAVTNLIEVLKDDYDYFFIPDCRFPNEVNYLITKFGIDKIILVKIHRKDFISPLTKEQQEHPSETSLDNYPANYYIEVGEGLDKVKQEVKNFLAFYNM
mgnify:CR=1 FL=1